MSWKSVASEAQSRVLEAIPAKWKLSQAQKSSVGSDCHEFPVTCGILSDKQIEITEQTVTQLLGNLAAGKLKAYDVAESFCARAAIAHQLTNCLIDFFPEEALKTAAALDEYFAKTGKLIGPLHGIPVSLKDLYDLKGHILTLGYVSWANFISPSDSSMVQVLRDAGAVFYVKTTMPQAGMAAETVSNLWGRTLNPYSSKLSAGGSSGGESSLIALKGSPIGPATDIGGSIRGPAAFNGLYGYRVTSERVPRRGVRTTLPGQISVKASYGPLCHSMADLKLFCKLINAGTTLPYEGNVVPMDWREIAPPTRKLSLAYFEFDGVVMPHPPVRRALQETVAKLKAAGHDVFEVKVPFDCWEAAMVTWALYFPTGAREFFDFVAEGKETAIPAFEEHLKIFGVRELSVAELCSFNVKQAAYKTQIADFWKDTASKTKSGAPIDGLICPSFASTSFTHDFPSWWGYLSMFNLVDYPSIIIPLKDFKITAEKDPKDTHYVPLDTNPLDRSTWEMYDPELFSSMPVTIQVVGRPYKDEEVIAVSEVIDKVINQ